VRMTEWRDAPRNYVVPGKLVKSGRNVIAVRLFNRCGAGGRTSSRLVLRRLSHWLSYGWQSLSILPFL